MKRAALLTAALAATVSAVYAGPFDQIKGKMKEGLYDYKMQMEIAGMPAGATKVPYGFQHCVTQRDIDEGGFSKGRDAKTPENCEIRNMKVSGNTASYTMECKGEHAMKADNVIVFSNDGFNMDMKMAMTRNGQVMNMTQKMEGRYLGPCKK